MAFRKQYAAVRYLFLILVVGAGCTSPHPLPVAKPSVQSSPVALSEANLNDLTLINSVKNEFHWSPDGKQIGMRAKIPAFSGTQFKTGPGGRDGHFIAIFSTESGKPFQTWALEDMDSEPPVDPGLAIIHPAATPLTVPTQSPISETYSLQWASDSRRLFLLQSIEQNNQYEMILHTFAQDQSEPDTLNIMPQAVNKQADSLGTSFNLLSKYGNKVQMNPQGNQFAFFTLSSSACCNMLGLKVYDLATHSATFWTSFDPTQIRVDLSELEWAPDGQSIFVNLYRSEGATMARSEVYETRPGQSAKPLLSLPGYGRMTLSEDGSQLLTQVEPSPAWANRTNLFNPTKPLPDPKLKLSGINGIQPTEQVILDLKTGEQNVIQANLYKYWTALKNRGAFDTERNDIFENPWSVNNELALLYDPQPNQTHSSKPKLAFVNWKQNALVKEPDMEKPIPLIRKYLRDNQLAKDLPDEQLALAVTVDSISPQADKVLLRMLPGVNISSDKAPMYYIWALDTDNITPLATTFRQLVSCCRLQP